MPVRPRPLALIILDGWGYREATEANAILQAHKPNWDTLWKKFPHCLISGSGRCVGLPDGQMGNSEVGHLNMGAGRVVHQDLTRIDQAIQTGEFFQNPVLNKAIERSVETQKAIHVFGLLSPGGVHSHEKQIHALLMLAAKKGAKAVYLHMFLDGRDTPPRSAMPSLVALTALCQQLQCGQIASLIGRYYVMDRDKRWDRVQVAYDLLTSGKADYHADNAITGLELAYARGEHDEFVKATSIHAGDEKPVVVADGDTIIFMNFRADRAREITRAFIDTNFTEFPRATKPTLASFVTLTEYDATFAVDVAFLPERLDNLLAGYLSSLKLKQLRIAETEKYAHVTFFFNGGIEEPFPYEDRILIPSPKVATYDLKPEMSAYELTDRLISEIKRNEYDVIICNFANPDMVGHTGNFDAAVKAIETIDTCLGKIVPVLLEAGGEALITADHGNAELMFDDITQQPHTAHTSELVPLLYIGWQKVQANLVKQGNLADIAPTMLHLMGLPQPKEMTGQPLFL